MGQTGSERAGGKGLGRAPSGPQQEETQALLLPQQQKSDKVVSRKNSSTLGTASTGDASQASSREAAAALLRKQRTTSQFNSQFSSQKRGLLSRARALPRWVFMPPASRCLWSARMHAPKTTNHTSAYAAASGAQAWPACCWPQACSVSTQVSSWACMAAKEGEAWAWVGPKSPHAQFTCNPCTISAQTAVFVKLLGARVPVLELSAIRGFLSVVMSLMMGAYMGLKGLKVLGAKERWGLLTGAKGCSLDPAHHAAPAHTSVVWTRAAMGAASTGVFMLIARPRAHPC